MGWSPHAHGAYQCSIKLARTYSSQPSGIKEDQEEGYHKLTDQSDHEDCSMFISPALLL